MKTSTSILVIFFLIVFLTPFLIALALSRKVSKGEFRTVKNDFNRSLTKLKTGGFKVLDIKSNSSNFGCLIVKDDSSFITYEDWRKEDVSVANNGDTLHVIYKDADVNQQGRDYFEITIHVQDPSTMFAEKAILAIVPNDYYKNHPLTLELNNASKLRFMSSPVSNMEVDETGNEDTSGARIAFNNIVIKSDASEVRLPALLEMNALTLDIRNKSKLLLPAGLRYRQLSATVSDDTEVQAPWHIVKGFKTAAGSR